MNLFVKARLVSRQSTDLTAATLQAQAAAETIKSTGQDTDELASLLGATPSQEGYLVCYNEEWKPVQSGRDAVYEMKIVLHEEGRELASDITVQKAGDVIYSLATARYNED